MFVDSVFCVVSFLVVCACCGVVVSGCFCLWVDFVVGAGCVCNVCGTVVMLCFC